MGEIADWMMEQHEVDLWENGGLVECKFCGLGELHWDFLADGRWRLFGSDGHLHSCPQYRQPKEATP